MNVKFPQFSFTITKDPKRKVIWEGTVTITIDTGKPHEHTIRIECPAAYPKKVPRVFIDNLRGKRPPHLYSDGSICLFWIKDHYPLRWTKNHTLDFIISESVYWLYEYYIWQIHGRSGKRWPAEEAPHAKR